MTISYTQFISFSAHLAGREIQVVSKPGQPNWDSVSPAAYLLAEFAALQPGERTILLGCGHGATAAAVGLAQPNASLWLMDFNQVSLQSAAQTLLANGVDKAQVLAGIELPEEICFDVALLDLPKGRLLLRRWLVQAFQALRPGGRLLLAGAKDLGVQPAVQDADSLYGPGAILDYKKGSRVVQFSRPEALPGPGWWDEPGVAPHTWLEFEVALPTGQAGVSKGSLPTPDASTLPKPAPTELLRLASLPGVFSAGRLDEGTGRLLDEISIEPADRVLDLGCGYGVIGVYAARQGAAWIDLVDSNLLAVASAKENLRRYTIANAAAIPSDALSAVQGHLYNLIVSNPPFHSGKAVDYQMSEAFIEQSYAALAPKGRLVLVANQFIRYERLLATRFRKVRTLAETSSYHVLSAVK